MNNYTQRIKKNYGKKVVRKLHKKFILKLKKLLLQVTLRGKSHNKTAFWKNKFHEITIAKCKKKRYIKYVITQKYICTRFKWEIRNSQFGEEIYGCTRQSEASQSHSSLLDKPSDSKM